MSIDEGQQIHELWGAPVRALFSINSGMFFVGWTIPAIIFSIVLLVVFSKFFVSIPLLTKKLLLLSSVVYICGAIGIESISSSRASTKPITTEIINARPVYETGSYLPFVWLFTLEETLELVGISMFICTLTNYIGNRKIYVLFRD